MPAAPSIKNKQYYVKHMTAGKKERQKYRVICYRRKLYDSVPKIKCLTGCTAENDEMTFQPALNHITVTFTILAVPKI